MSEQVWSVITMTPRGIGPEDLGQERHVRQCRILARAKSRAAFARKLIASGIEYRSEAAVGAWLRDLTDPQQRAEHITRQLTADRWAPIEPASVASRPGIQRRRQGSGTRAVRADPSEGAGGMSYDNRLTAEKIATLQPGDTVTIEEWRGGYREPRVDRGAVVRLTPTQVVIDRGRYEDRFRREDAQRVGDRNAELIDPDHPRSVETVKRARRIKRATAIENLAYQWKRSPRDLDLLRQLRATIDEYLAAEDAET